MSTTPVDSNTNNESTYSLSQLKVVQLLHSVGACVQPSQDESEVPAPTNRLTPIVKGNGIILCLDEGINARAVVDPITQSVLAGKHFCGVETHWIEEMGPIEFPTPTQVKRLAQDLMQRLENELNTVENVDCKAFLIEEAGVHYMYVMECSFEPSLTRSVYAVAAHTVKHGHYTILVNRSKKLPSPWSMKPYFSNLVFATFEDAHKWLVDMGVFNSEVSMYTNMLMFETVRFFSEANKDKLIFPTYNIECRSIGAYTCHAKSTSPQPAEDPAPESSWLGVA